MFTGFCHATGSPQNDPACLRAGPGHHGGPDRAGPSIYDCCCLLGYCMLPMVICSATALLIPRCVCTAQVVHESWVPAPRLMPAVAP